MIRSNLTQVNLNRQAEYKLNESSLARLLENIDFSTAYSRIINKYRYLRAGAGRKPHPPIAMLKALILKELMQIQSRRKLAKFLKTNEYWLRKCGFRTPPHHDCFSEFINRLGKDLFEWLFSYLVDRLRKLKAIKGKDIAVDSTLIKAYAKPKEDKCSDPDAKWGYSATKDWIFGYKLHLACDADTELPLTFDVTSANIHDSNKYPDLIRDVIIKKNIRFKYVLADAGYDSKENRLTTEMHGAIPIIAINPRRRDIEEAIPSSSHYKKRSSVERIFSRLKEELCLKMVKVRRLWRIKVHAAISLIAMLCVAIVAVKTGNWSLLTSISYFKF